MCYRNNPHLPSIPSRNEHHGVSRQWHQPSCQDCAMNEAAAAAESLQSCPTLCDSIDGSPPGSPVPGIFHARVLEWGAISFSNAWKWKVKVKLLSRVWLLVTWWTAAYQAPPSMGFSRQEYWSGVPLPSPNEWSSPSQKLWMDCQFLFCLRQAVISVFNSTK